MLITTRVTFKEGFAVIAITDGKTRVLVSMTLSMRWQWATCQPSFANSFRVAKRLCYLFGLHCKFSTSCILLPIHAITGTAIEFPSALYLGPSGVGLPLGWMSV
jgi:hypothetical protein